MKTYEFHPQPFIPKDVVRAADKLEDVKIETSDISDRFKFFETYRPKSERKEFRMTPPRQTQVTTTIANNNR